MQTIELSPSQLQDILATLRTDHPLQGERLGGIVDALDRIASSNDGIADALNNVAKAITG